jgi:hypothetical protein
VPAPAAHHWPAGAAPAAGATVPELAPATRRLHQMIHGLFQGLSMENPWIIHRLSMDYHFKTIENLSIHSKEDQSKPFETIQ